MSRPMTAPSAKHARIPVATKRLTGGGRSAHAKCRCGWVAVWPRTQAEAADAYRAHKRQADETSHDKAEDTAWLSYDAEARVYRAQGHPLGEGYVCPTGDDRYSFQPTGASVSEVSFSVVGREYMEQVLAALAVIDTPHSKLVRKGSTRKGSAGYYYEPWAMDIVADTHDPFMGWTWKSDVDGVTVYWNRLKNLRAVLSALADHV